MDGWSMPAPAPCASTRHVFAAAGRCISPDTRICSLTEIVTDCGMEDATPLVCTETQAWRGTAPRSRPGKLVPRYLLFVWYHARPKAPAPIIQGARWAVFVLITPSPAPA